MLTIVTERTFGSTELFGPNDRTFFCRTPNFSFILLQFYCLNLKLKRIKMFLLFIENKYFLVFLFERNQNKKMDMMWCNFLFLVFPLRLSGVKIKLGIRTKFFLFEKKSKQMNGHGSYHMWCNFLFLVFSLEA